MSKSKSASKEVRIFAKLDKGVMSTIKLGTEAYTNATNAFKQAAVEFVGTIKLLEDESHIPLALIPDVVKQSREIYAEYFPDHNKCQVFGCRVALLLAGDEKLHFQNRKKEQLSDTAEAAALYPEDTMKKAHSALLEKIGKARAPGGGRTSEAGSDTPATPDQQPANGPVTTVFSIVEMKSQLAGLFGNSSDPIGALNTLLADYKALCVPSEDFVAFQEWQAEQAKPAPKRRTRAKKAA